MWAMGNSPKGPRRIAYAVLIPLIGCWWLITGLSVYREVVFNTVSLDDYSGLLNWLVHLGASGEVPGSPFRERILSVVLAIPFYHLPIVRFSLLNTTLSPDTLHAFLALALSNVMGLAVAGLVVARLTYGKTKSETGALIAGSFPLLSSGYLSLSGVDGIGVMAIALGLAALEAEGMLGHILFGAVLLLNEKCAIFFIPYTAAMFFFAKERTGVKMLYSIFVFAIYILIRRIDGQGDAHQVDPSTFLAGFSMTLYENISAKGIMLFVAPLMIALVGPAFAYMIDPQSRAHATSTLLGTAALVLSAFVANTHYGVGRITLYALPAIALVTGMAFSRVSGLTEARATPAPT
jgi:hypothetical protein